MAADKPKPNKLRAKFNKSIGQRLANDLAYVAFRGISTPSREWLGVEGKTTSSSSVSVPKKVLDGDKAKNSSSGKSNPPLSTPLAHQSHSLARVELRRTQALKSRPLLEVSPKPLQEKFLSKGRNANVPLVSLRLNGPRNSGGHRIALGKVSGAKHSTAKDDGERDAVEEDHGQPPSSKDRIQELQAEQARVNAQNEEIQ
ncbi:hypothetical protein VNI00_005401 [Paramarasmius palmivorus]|uniref:Uncharacterized protein n=1 Tax=Paramarasmius palmivorus TaxID=297713 RepID=A0AAW0DE40_9AGAR